MINTLTDKLVNLTPPAAIVNNAAVTVASVDTKGFNYLDIILIFGATDIALTVCKLTTSDTDSAYADYVGSRYGTDQGSSLPSATADNTFVAWHVDLRGKKRWWKPAITVGSGSTGAYVCVIAILSRAEQQPNTLATRGLGQELFI